MPGTTVEGGINRVVWAFCGLLTHSRLPYVESSGPRTSRASPGASGRCGTSTARAMLAVMDEHAGRRYFDQVCLRAERRSVVLPQTLRRMLEAAANEPIFRTDLKLSKLGEGMVHDVSYYLN